MAATRPAGPGSYPWLPTLEDASEEPNFQKLFPNLAQVLQNVARSSPGERSFAPTISPARRRLLEQAAVQARPASTRQRGGDVSSNEEQLLQVLADLLAQEREDIRLETEAKLRAAFSAPPGERRTLIEAQRQKWRALEESVRELSDLVKDPKEDVELSSEDNRRMRDAKAIGALKVLKKAEHMPTRQKVQLLQEILDSYRQKQPIKEAGTAVSSLLKLGGNSTNAQTSLGSPRPGTTTAEALRGGQEPHMHFFPYQGDRAEEADKREEDRRRQEAVIREQERQRMQQEFDAKAEALERQKEESERKLRQIEEETRERMKQELARQAEAAQQKNNANALAQAARLEEIQQKMDAQQREKDRMEAEMVALKRQAEMSAGTREANRSEALLRAAEEKEQQMKEEHERSLEQMRAQIEANASVEFKRQLSQNEAKQKQAETDAQRAAMQVEQANALRAAEEERFQKMHEEDEAKLRSAQDELNAQKKKNLFAGRLKTGAAAAQTEALQKQAEQQEAARKQAEDEYDHLKKQVAMASKMKGAAGAQRQKELQQKADEANERLKEAESRSKVMGQMQNAVLKQQKADLEAEKQKWNNDKDNLIQQMRTQQLEIASMAVRERQRLLRANRAARLENYRQQWWSDVDVQRISAAKHVLVRAARASKADYDETAAHYTAQSRNANGGAQKRIASAVGEANGFRAGELTDDSMAGRRGGRELTENLDGAFKSIHSYKRDMEMLTRDLVPGPEGEAVFASLGSPSSKKSMAQLEEAIRTDRDQINEKKNAAESRLREAEAQLDALTADDIAADLASSWADTVGAMAAEKRSTERKRKDLEDRIEKQLALDSETELQRAKAASTAAFQASEANSEATRAERQRQAEENSRRVEAALQEAEQQRLVPVRVKLTGFKMSQIRDREAFERAFAEKVRSTLDLDESQLRVLEISPGTG